MEGLCSGARRGEAGPAPVGVRRDLGGFCMEAVGWCWLGPCEGLAATALGMDADATGPVL